MHPLVSVIVPTYNRPERLQKTLGSILGQTYSNFEVIIVNDGGTDAAGDVVRKIGDPRFRYYATPHRERSAARNYGLQCAKGTYITFCDDDDLWLPEKLQRQVQFMQNTGAIISYTNAWIELPNGKRRLAFSRPPRNFIAAALTRNLAPLITYMVERTLFSTIGGFDEHLSAGEDYDLWLRALPHYQFYVLNVPLAVYVWHGSNTIQDKQRMSIAMNAVASKNLERLLADHPTLVPPKLERRAKRHFILRVARREFRDYHYGRALSAIFSVFSVRARIR